MKIKKMKYPLLTIGLLYSGNLLAQVPGLVPRVHPLDSLPGPQYRFVPPGPQPWLNQRDTSYVTYSEWDNMPILRPGLVEPMPGAFPQPVPQFRNKMAPMPNPMQPRRRDIVEKPLH
ncbi:hypothetical protein [Telluribacter sp. SYSU D00476]|uniref:hypothetical protein n=1 Tax=Telluribacter sp. SYSU D00476 TaxID=2811430 RepID=UPI001FF31148|nr:hypothetical protein [Telluribacter sp. SYSU D00476]